MKKYGRTFLKRFSGQLPHFLITYAIQKRKYSPYTKPYRINAYKYLLVPIFRKNTLVPI